MYYVPYIFQKRSGLVKTNVFTFRNGCKYNILTRYNCGCRQRFPLQEKKNFGYKIQINYNIVMLFRSYKHENVLKNVPDNLE